MTAPHKVSLFGPLIDLTSSNRVHLHGHTVEELRVDFIRQFPEAKNHHWATAVNQRWAKEDQAISWGDEIAFLPPFAGG